MAAESLQYQCNPSASPRFSLKVHRENRKVPSLALKVNSQGARLRKSSSKPDDSSSVRERHIAAEGSSMASFAERLSRPPFNFGRPVIDETRLAVNYDFELDWGPDSVTEVRRAAQQLPICINRTIR